MIRLLVCFAYFFRGQRMLPWLFTAGVALLALGLLVPEDWEPAATMIGGMLAAGFPILVGGLAYRQLVANRRVVMVPDVRVFATGALFLLALWGTALAVYVTSSFEPRPDPWIVGLLAFALISLYLIISQWIMTYRAGGWVFFLLPIVTFRFAIRGDAELWARVFTPWAWAALAGLAWLWLAAAVYGKGLPRSWVLAHSGSASADSDRTGFWRPRSGTFATPEGTLMRGGADGWRKRIGGALMIVLLFPVVMSAVIILMGIPARNPDAGQVGAEFFLGVSFLGFCIFPAMIFAEWPVRLRLLWLRFAGDRPRLWQKLERTLLRDLMLVAAVAAIVAAAFLIWSDVERDLVYLYLAGGVLASLCGSYLGFVARIAGWHSLLQGLMFMIFLIGFIIGGTRLRNTGGIFATFWLLPLIVGIAFVLRREARSRFLRVDWCKVRPLRFPRRPA